MTKHRVLSSAWIKIFSQKKKKNKKKQKEKEKKEEEEEEEEEEEAWIKRKVSCSLLEYF